MKKSAKKTINYLSRYIGHEVLRTKSARGDWSYTRGNPILFLGFTSDGCIRYCHTGIDALVFGDQEYVLPFHFTDRNWITYKKAQRAKNNKLNQLKGKKIRRITPTKRIGDCSYMCRYPFEKAPTLISASKYHVVIEYNDGLKVTRRTLGPDFADSSEWKLAE